MQFIFRLFRGIWYLAWYLFAATIVLLAAVFGMLRLLLPLLGDYNRDIERIATQYAGRPVKIMSLDAEWHGFGPSLVLNNVRLLSNDGKDTLLVLARARLDFDLLAIAQTKKVQFRRFALSGANLSLVRQTSGQISLSGFESSKIEATDSEENGEILQWLLTQGEIDLHARNLIFRDQLGKKKRYYFSNVSFVLKNQGSRHLINGAIGFTEQSQQEFQFRMDIGGDITAAGGWSGTMYFNGLNIDVNKIFGPLRLMGHQFSVGKSNFKLWSDWSNGLLTGVQGDVSLENVKAESNKNSIPILSSVLPIDSIQTKSENNSISGVQSSVAYQNLIGRFSWNRFDKGWKFLADKFVVSRDRRVWPTSQIALHYYQDQNDSRHVNFHASLVRVEDITPLVPIFAGNYKNYNALVEQLAASGDLENVNFTWSGKGNQYRLAARLNQVAMAEVNKLPAVKGLSGVLRLDNERGSFGFNTGQGEFYLPTIFRWEIPVRKISGDVDWMIGSKNILVSTRNLELDSADFQSKAVFDIEIPKSGGTPFVSLITSFKNADASKASSYYPVSIMSEKALKWLDAAIVQGNITSGGAIVYGPIQEFPFTKGQGVFDVRFSVDNAMLDYADEWPELHSAHADVIFRGNSASISVDRGKIYDSDVSDTQISIPDLFAKPIQVDIAGKVTGKLQNKINYLLTAPPLKKEFEKGLSDIRVSGDGRLDLKIGLTIGSQVSARVDGKLQLNDNKLELVQVSDLLSHINGSVNFDENSISARGITADLLGQPAAISVSTRDSRYYKNVRVNEYKAVGRFNAKSLSKLKFPFLNDMVDGDARWTVKLTAPHSKDGSPVKQDLQLTVDSDLKGVRVNLPPPFKKEKPDIRKLKVTTTFKDARNTRVKVSYAGEFEGILLNDFTKPRWMSRGELRFGGGPAVLPDNTGLHIAGNMKYVSYDIWQNLIKQLLEQYTNKPEPMQAQQTVIADSGQMDFSIINSVNLSAENFEIFGQKASNAKIGVVNKGTWLAVDIDSNKFKGRITVPDNFNDKPLVLDMQYLNITPIEESGTTLNPKELPAIKLNSRSVTYGNKQLGLVAIETAKSADGLLLEQMIIRPRSTTIKAHGNWLIQNHVENSSLELTVDSENLGDVMKDLGYVETVADGKGTITAKLSWPAALVDPDMMHINGEITLNLKNGRILDIEPGGAARLFGLFSLQTLPRRLTLDFSDIFSKGLGFDTIKGKFNIEDGDAYTSNLKMKGPNADVAMKGRIGLGTQDYDQKIIVTPHITDAAILLSIITSQPLLLLFQQLLKQDLDAATSFEYTLVGSWDNYQLNPVLKKLPSPSSEGEEF